MSLTIKTTFNDLEAGDELWHVEKSTGKVVSRRIYDIKEPSNRRDYLLISYYKLAQPADVDTKRILDEKSDEIPVNQLMVPKTSSIVLTKQMPPQVWAANKSKLEEWMKNTG